MAGYRGHLVASGPCPGGQESSGAAVRPEDVRTLLTSATSPPQVAWFTEVAAMLAPATAEVLVGFVVLWMAIRYGKDAYRTTEPSGCGHRPRCAATQPLRRPTMSPRLWLARAASSWRFAVSSPLTHGLEYRDELGVPVLDQELQTVRVVVEVHRQVSGLPRHLLPCRAGAIPVMRNS
jgi:hypothetical protein